MQFITILVSSSLLLSLLLNYSFNQLFLKRNKIDKVKPRSSHNVIATKSGGVAIFSSLGIITIFLYATSNEIFDFSLLLPLGIIFFTGVYDDFYDANFKLKFFLQIIVAKLLIDQGFLINNFHGLFGFYEIPYLLAQLTTIFTFVIIVNAINFSDGIDGLACSLGIYCLIILEIFMGLKSELMYLNLISAVLIIPFYFFNSKKKNKVFLGDAGSLFLGAIVAINIFNFLSNEKSVEVFYNPAIISIVVLIYPLVDLLRVFILRIKSGNSPFVADQNHLHHKLIFISNNHYIRTLLIILSSICVLFIILMLEFNFDSIYSIVFILLLQMLTFKIK